MPQAAILGIHAIKEKPVVVNGEIVIRPIMVVALTYDHRLLDGREAVTMLGMFRWSSDCLGCWLTLLHSANQGVHRGPGEDAAGAQGMRGMRERCICSPLVIAVLFPSAMSDARSVDSWFIHQLPLVLLPSSLSSTARSVIMSDTWTARVDAIKARTLAQIPADVRINEADLPSRVIDLPQTSDLLSPLEQRIIHLDAVDLRDKIARGGLTSVQVTEAFIKSAALAHQATQCLTHFFPEEALERARWLDERLRETGRPVGPLHGVPISVKVGDSEVRDRAGC